MRTWSIRNILMKNFFSKPSITIVDISAIILLTIIVFFYSVLGLTAADSSTQPHALSVGYMAQLFSDTGALIIDSGKGRVIGVKDNKVDFEILVGNGEDTFYQAENLAVGEDGSFYVQSVDWDSSGFLLGSERVLHYDADGNYLETAMIMPYEPQDEVNQHRVFDPRVIDGKLYFVYADETGVRQYRVEDGENVEVCFFPHDDAWIYFQNYAQAAEGELYGVEKTGKIIRFSDRGEETVYTYDSASHEVMFFAERDAEGNLYYVDIYNGRVCRVTSESTSEEIVNVSSLYPNGEFKEGSDTMTSLKIGEMDGRRVLSFMLNNRLVQVDEDGKILTDRSEIELGSIFKIRCVQFWVLVIGAACILVYFLLRGLFYFIVVKPEIGIIWKVEAGFAVFALGLTFMILTNMSGTFGRSYMISLAEQLGDLAITGCNRFESEWIENTGRMEDYMGEDYAQMSSLLYSLTTELHSYDRRYGAEVEILDPDGRAYCRAYTDNSIGVYYPLDETSKQELEIIYETGQPRYNLDQVAAGGSFIFGRAPIFDEDENVIGVLSVTLDSFKEQEVLRTLTQETMLGVILIVIIIMFLINELFAVADGKAAFEAGREAVIAGKKIPVYLIRIAAFGVSFVLNMTSSFLSVYTSSFWNETLGISPSLAGAIPLFANGAFIAVSALFCPVLLEKIGFLGLTAVGVVCSSCGDLLAGLSASYFSIVAALLLNGLGFGILINTLSITIGRISDNDKRENGYARFNAGCIAGINSGMIFGSILVSRIRYNQVFFVTSVLWASLILIFFVLGKMLPKAEKKVHKAVRRERAAIPLQAVFYSVCIAFPYAVMGSFMYFYLPIFVTSQGYSEAYVSLLMMIYAACGIFLGKGLTGLLWDKLRIWSVFSAIVIAMGGWLIMAVYPTLSMACLAMVLIGISCSFGLNVCMTGYLQGTDVAQMRGEDAVGIYEFSSRAGQCLSPIICGIMMGAGLVTGMFGMAVIAVGLFLGYVFIFRKKLGKEQLQH